MPKGRSIQNAETLFTELATPPAVALPQPAPVTNVVEEVRVLPVYETPAKVEPAPPMGGQVMMFTPVNNHIVHTPDALNTGGSGTAGSTGKKNKKRKLDAAADAEQQTQAQNGSGMDVTMSTPVAPQEYGEPVYNYNEEAGGGASPSPNNEGATATESAGKPRSKRAKSESPPLQLDLTNPRITNYLKKAGYMNDDGTPAKRKRGRPTKDPFGLSVTLKKQLMALDPNAPPSKKRGRPRKNFLMLDDEDDEVVMVGGIDDETEAEEEFDAPGSVPGAADAATLSNIAIQPQPQPQQLQFMSVNVAASVEQLQEEKRDYPLPSPVILRSNAPAGEADSDISPRLRRAIESIGEGLTGTTINIGASGTKSAIPSNFMAVPTQAPPPQDDDDTEDEEAPAPALAPQPPLTQQVQQHYPTSLPPPTSRPQFQQPAGDRYMSVAEQVDRFKQGRDSGEDLNKPLLNVPAPVEHQQPQRLETATIPVRKSSHGTLGHILN